MRARVEAKSRLLVVAGCSSTVMDDVAEAMTMARPVHLRLVSKWFRLGGGVVDLCCINRAARLFPSNIVYSFHPDFLIGERFSGVGASRPVLASCNSYVGVAHYPLSAARRKGSSALQAGWLALEDWGYSALIFCGVCLGSGDCFGGIADYSFFRRHWPAFAQVHADRCRAMSGYTAELFGRPDRSWIETMMEA